MVDIHDIALLSPKERIRLMDAFPHSLVVTGPDKTTIECLPVEHSFQRLTRRKVFCQKCGGFRRG